MSLFVTKDTSSTSWLGSNVTGDTQNRYVVQAGGKILWGPGGTSALDVILQRSALQFFANPLLTLYRGDGTTPGDLQLNSVCLSNNSAIINLQGNNALELPTEWTPNPTHGWTDLGNGNILFRNTSVAPPNCQFKDGVYTSLFQVMVQDPSDLSNYTPFLATDHGFWVEKDIMTYGALFTTSDPAKHHGGGAILIGHGLERDDDPPRINLSDYTAGYDTLYITAGSSVNKPNGADDVLSNMKLKNLTATGNVTVNGNLVVCGAFWNTSLINALFNFPEYITGFGQTFLSNLLSTIGNTLHFSSNKVDINPSSSPTLAGLTLNGALQVNAPSQTGITLGNGTIYWQTATNPNVLEMNCGLIIDGALNVAGISVNGTVGITGQASANNFWINGSWLNSSSTLYIGGASGAPVTMYMNGNVNPISDNSYGLGSGSNRWQGIVAVNGYFNNLYPTGELRIPTSAPGSPQNGDIWLA